MNSATLLLLACLQTEAPVLDGKAKTLVVVGYSTSFKWPAMFQEMLDLHAGKKGVYRVVNASVGGSPVAKWTGMTNARDRERTFGKMIKQWFGGDRSKPTVALCQQSLQWVFGDRRAGIRGPDDKERIRKGADAFARLAKDLNEAGVETVFIAAHVYKVTMEPQIENEKYALEALVKRKIPYVRAGPDVWTPTKKVFPAGFARDRVHPNEKGARVMAVAWYRTVAGKDVKEEVIRKTGGE